MVGIASKRRLRTAAILVGTAILAVSCAPIIAAPDSQPLNRPTPTDVPPTKTASPTPQPTKTPEPTRIPILGIDIPVETEYVSFQFKKAYIVDNYLSDIDGVNYHTKPPRMLLRIDGIYKGNMHYFPANSQPDLKDSIHIKGTIPVAPQMVFLFWHGVNHPDFTLISTLKLTDPGPYSFNDKNSNLNIDLTTIFDRDSLPNSIKGPDYISTPTITPITTQVP